MSDSIVELQAKLIKNLGDIIKIQKEIIESQKKIIDLNNKFSNGKINPALTLSIT